MKSSLIVAALAMSVPSFAFAQTRDEKVRADREKVESDGFWIYNDVAKGMAEAKASGKPLFVILRCVPCVECVKLDDDLVNQNERVRPLLEQFVRVRVVATNGLDLALFQFDTDQSFAAFMLNADGTIYGRFGTRSHRTYWSDDVSIDGLAKALEGALALHAKHPANRQELSAKKGPPVEFATPESFPEYREKYSSKLDYEGKLAQSCIHCHQIGDAARERLRERPEPIPEQILFSYPHPKTIGLILDPRERATVSRVEPKTPAAAAGFEAGDVLLALEGQPLLSIADVQWVLHHASATGASLAADVRRGADTKHLTLALPKGWRRGEDLSWRASTWGLRKMATGGMLLESLSAEERDAAGIPAGSMALRAKHVGEFGEHAVAKKAGFVKGDIITRFDGQSNLARETDLIAYALERHRPGDKVLVDVLRSGQKIELVLTMQ